MFTGKVADTVAQDVTILKLKEAATVDWKREEHVTIEVKDFSHEAFLLMLSSCYTGTLYHTNYYIAPIREEKI